MTLTNQEIYDLSLIGARWHLESLKPGSDFSLSGIIYTLGELRCMTANEAKAATKRIARKGFPKSPIRQIFDKQIVVCLARPGKNAHAVLLEAIENSPKHFASLPGVNGRHSSNPTALTFPLRITASGHRYILAILPRYAARHNFTKERFEIAFADHRKRAAAIAANKRKREREKQDED